MVKDQSFYENTGQFYKSIATSTNLHAGYESKFTLGFTLDATTVYRYIKRVYNEINEQM